VAEVERLLAQVKAGDVKDFNIILKTDVVGSGEAIRAAIEGLSNDKVLVKIIRSSSGLVTESDVLLAVASKATIMAFSTRVEPGARKLAELEGVRVRSYDIIYRLVEDVQAAVSGLVEPTFKEVVEAKAEVKEVFKVKGGKVAGIGVTEGKLNRNAQIRVLRNGDVLHESKIKSLRHFKDSVRELVAGSEGGVGLEGFDDYEVGDTLEAFRKEQVEAPSRPS
jgi:translation initiation factor IF-2